MGNIKNYNFKMFDVKLSNSHYWDFYLADDTTTVSHKDLNNCLLASFDFNNSDIFTSGSPTTISSLTSWSGAINTGYTFSTIGLTGIDNGLIQINHDLSDDFNNNLLDALTGSTLIIPSGDTRLHLNQVSGSTGNYIYPINQLTDNTGNYVKLSGGFYQGYYAIDGSNYQVLPNRSHQGFTTSFLLRRDDITTYTGETLNTTYPNNKGFFFYLGTRAENKFWSLFNGADTGCTSGCTIESGCTDTLSPWCTIPKESSIFIEGIVNSADTISLFPDQTITSEITNKFLIFGRANQGGFYPCNTTPSGLGNQTIWSWDGNSTKIVTPKTIRTNFQNPFLIFGRANQGGFYPCNTTPSGFGNQTTWSFTGFSESIEFNNINYKLDIIDNAIGFRLKDDGSIGYRLLTVTGHCSGNTYVSGVTIQEGYSSSGIIPYQTWTSIIVRFSLDDYYDDCKIKDAKPRTGKLMFYINGKLKFIVDNLNEFICRRLDEHMEKQIGVPFNMSLGGGSQGLIETLTFGGIDSNDLELPIEANFAGSFIGDLRSFNYYDCDLNFVDIQHIYMNDSSIISPSNNSLILENNNSMLTENGDFISIF